MPKKMLSNWKGRGIAGFLSYVLAENKAILKVAKKTPFPVQVTSAGECYEVKISFNQQMIKKIALGSIFICTPLV